MSPQSTSNSSHSNNPSPINPRHGPVLPPIVPPGEAPRNMSEPQSTTSAGFPPLSREGSLSSTEGHKMHHILNPTGGPDSGSKPPTPDMGARQPLPPISLSRSVSSERLAPSHPGYGGSVSQRSHLMAAPTLSSPTGTIDAVKSPFLPISGSRAPLPTGPPAPTSQPYSVKPGYPFPQQPQTAPGPISRRGSDPVSAHGSRTGSPAPSYASYASYGQSSTAQGSPRSQFSSVTHHGSQALYHAQHGGAMSQQVPSPQQIQPQGQFPSAGHHTVVQRGASYHMILDTDHGPIQVPMDVNVASKTADEKRKRNAGASARFRQRRKEKEKESATTISKLEDKVRELTEDKDFYRLERDYFKDLVYKNESARAMLVPRGPSPSSLSDRNRQSSLASSREGGRSPSSGGAAEYQESGDRGSDDGRILRRRISGYEPDQRATSQHHARQQEQQQGRQHPQQSSSYNPTSTPSPQHANTHYVYQRSESQRGVPGPPGHAAHLQAMTTAPQTMRTGPYEPNGHSHHVYHEMRWVPPS